MVVPIAEAIKEAALVGVETNSKFQLDLVSAPFRAHPVCFSDLIGYLTVATSFHIRVYAWPYHLHSTFYLGVQDTG